MDSDNIDGGAIHTEAAATSTPVKQPGIADQSSKKAVPRRRRNKSRDLTPIVFAITEMVPRYVVVYGSELIYDSVSIEPMKPNALRLAVGPDAFNEWLRHPDKRVIKPSQIVFDPTNTCSADCINLFRGFPLTPKNGDCSLILELLDHLISQSADDDEGISSVKNFILNWMAYPLQHPGTKMASALVFHGPQGTGKDLFLRAYSRIFGTYAAVIGQSQLDSRYNDWASGKLFLTGNEVAAPNDQVHQKNALKMLVTEETIQIEGKFKDVRIEKNHVNFAFNSNDNKPLALERDDRRYLIVYCPEKRTDGLYDRVVASLDHGAVEALYAFLLQRDLGDFHPHTKPVMTKAKDDLVELGLRPAERFAREWLHKEVDLPLHPCSTGQLYRAFQRWCSRCGERNPANQAYFSTAVTKYARGRVTTKKASPSPLDVGVAITLWLPQGTGPIEGVRWYDFAQQCVAEFEGPLSRYCNGAREEFK